MINWCCLDERAKKIQNPSFLRYIHWKSVKAQHRMLLQYSKLYKKRLISSFEIEADVWGLYLCGAHTSEASRDLLLLFCCRLIFFQLCCFQAEQEIPPAIFSSSSREKPAFSHNPPIVFLLLYTRTRWHCALLWCISSCNIIFASRV